MIHDSRYVHFEELVEVCLRHLRLQGERSFASTGALWISTHSKLPGFRLFGGGGGIPDGLAYALYAGGELAAPSPVRLLALLFFPGPHNIEYFCIIEL